MYCNICKKSCGKLKKYKCDCGHFKSKHREEEQTEEKIPQKEDKMPQKMEKTPQNKEKSPTVSKKPSSFQKGEEVEAMWEDGEYYHAVIDFPTSTGFQITFTEYSDTQTVPITSLRKLVSKQEQQEKEKKEKEKKEKEKKEKEKKEREERERKEKERKEKERKGKERKEKERKEKERKEKERKEKEKKEKEKKEKEKKEKEKKEKEEREKREKEEKEKSEFHIGQEIEAQWDDGKYYKARVESVSARKVSITFLNYSQTSEVPLNKIRLSLNAIPEENVEKKATSAPKVDTTDEGPTHIVYDIGEEIEVLWNDGKYYKAVVEEKNEIDANEMRYRIKFPEYDEILNDVPAKKLRKLNSKIAINLPISDESKKQKDKNINMSMNTLSDEDTAKTSDIILTLNSGRDFTKYGRSGKKNKRWVWLSADMQYIKWDSIQYKKERETIPLEKQRYLKTMHIKSIQKGAKSEILKKAISKLSDFEREKFDACVFSIIHGDRTLDLEADNEHLRNAWYDRFIWLQSYTAPGTAMGDGWREREKEQANQDTLLEPKKGKIRKSSKISTLAKPRKPRKSEIKNMFSPKSGRAHQAEEKAFQSNLDSPSTKKEVYQKGEAVEAMFEGEFYDATIDHATDIGYMVTYTEYQEKADLPVDQIRRFNPDMMDMVVLDTDSEKKANANFMVEYISALSDGFMFKHHEKKGKVTEKFVLVTSDMQFIKWHKNREKAEKSTDKHKCMKTSEITQIKKGATTATFETCLKDDPLKSAIASRSLSIVCGDQTLDLEAADEVTADKWIDRFKWLEEYQKNLKI